MFLYLVQHAEARSSEEDPSRGLSERGIQNITKVALYASKMGISISQIFHSGKTRANQTARVLADYLKVTNVSETEGIAPMDDPRIWAGRLSDLKKDIMLIGHLPHLDLFSSLLLCGDKDKKVIGFRMGGIVCLRRDNDSNWSLEWMITPEIVR
jgi:phosphohistidine phosphatase